MQQSSIIFGALFIGFLLYVTARGRLPAYVSLFWKGGTGNAGIGNQNLAPGFGGIPGLGLVPQQGGGSIIPGVPLLQPGFGAPVPGA